LPLAYIKASFPQVSQVANGDRDIRIRMYFTIRKYVCNYVIITIIVITLLSDLAIRILYGNKYHESSIVLIILMIGLLPWAYARIAANELVASNNQRYDLLSSVCATAANISLNITLIPKLGIIGAAIANTLSLSIFCIIECIALVRLKAYVRSIKEFKKSIALAAVIGIFIWLAKINFGMLCAEFILLIMILFFQIKKAGGIRAATKLPLYYINQVLCHPYK
jgi:O-antigen/teichoic acid export membrane protein